MAATGLVMASCGMLHAQTDIANYRLSRSTETYTPITGGTVLVTAGATYDQEISPAVTIPAMSFGGANVTTAYVHANGYVTFGAAHSTTTYTPLSTSGTSVTGVISAFGADLGYNGSNGTTGAVNEIRYQQIGDEFVAQFTDVKRWNIANERVSFQIRANSTTGVIKVIYGGTIVIGSSTTGLQVGIRGNSNTWTSNVNNLLIDNIPAGTTCSWSDAVTANANSATMYTSSANASVAPSAGLTFTWTPATSPAPVRTFAAVASITANSAVLSWTAPTGATQYNIRYRVPGSCGWTSFAGNPVTGTTATLTGLAATTTYQVQVQASNGSGASIWSHIPNAAGSGNGYSATGTFTTLASCGAPTGVAVPAASINSNTATVNWTAPTIGPPTSYKWEVRTSGAAGSGATGLAATGTSATATVNVTGLASATTYSVYVRTNCGASDSSLWTSAVNFTTLCTTPAPGATIASVSSNLCLGTTVAFSLTNATPGPGVTYQWQSSDNNVTFTNISGATSATYTGQVTTRYYRCIVKCSAGPDSTASGAVQLNYTNLITGTTAAQRCGTGTVNLAATGTSGATLSWYDVASGGTALGTGSPFTTPVINANTTYYVGSETSSTVTANGARPAPAATSNTTPFTYGLVFNATNAFTLNSVDVYNAGSAGTMTIQLQNSAGTPIQTSGVFNVPAGTGTTPYTAALGWTIPVGTGYRLVVTSGTASLVRESSLGGFPYAIGTVGSITSGYISGTSTTYYYLYNWNYTATITCSSPRIPVTATVNTPPAFSITPNQTICNGAITPLTVTSNTASFNTYTWSPVTNLYTNAAATTPYTAGTNATTVYLKSATPGSVVYTASANNASTLCAAVATDTITVLPATVTATANPGNLCVSGTAAVSLTPATGYGAATFKWQSAADNSTFADEGANSTAPGYTTPTLTATRYYRVRINNSAGAFCINSSSDTVKVNNPLVTATQPAARCGTGTVTLGATANEGTLNWYAAASGGASLGTGASFTTPSLTATTTYYVASLATPNVTATVGSNGTTMSTSGTDPLGQNWEGVRAQYLITAADLNAAGIFAGNLNSLSLFVTSKVSTFPFTNYTIKLGNTAATNLTGYLSPTMSTVYGPSTFSSVAGANNFAFANPYVWDGVSNLLVEVCFANDPTSSGTFWSSNDVVRATTKSYTASYGMYADNNNLCGTATGTSSSTTSLPDMTFTQLGCASPRVAVTATVNPNPTASITPTGTVQVCAGSTTTLTAAGGDSYQWRNTAGNINGQTTGTFTTGTAGTYRVVAITAATGCTDTSAPVIVNVNPLPVVNLGNDTTFCAGPVLTLNAGNSGAAYLWDNASTGQTRNVNNSGTYYVRVTDTNSCVKRDTIQVTVRPLPVVNLGNDTAFCYGNSITLNAGNPGMSYLWNDNSTAQTLVVNATGNYAVSVTDAFGCTGGDDINVLVKSLPSGIINAIHGDTATYTFNLINQLYVTGVTWNFGDGSPLVNGMEVQHRYATNGIYTVSATIQGECSDSILTARTVDVYDATGGVTGIGKVTDSKELVLYPNPARDLVTLENRNNLRMKHVTVYNVVGQTVYDAKAESADKHRIQTHSFTSGIYTIRIETEKGFVIRKFEILK